MKFVCRTGHKVGSSYHKDWQSDYGETFRFVVVESATPPIKGVIEWSSSVEITTMSGEELPEETILGNGETEEEAWESFWENQGI